MKTGSIVKKTTRYAKYCILKWPLSYGVGWLPQSNLSFLRGNGLGGAATRLIIKPMAPNPIPPAKAKIKAIKVLGSSINIVFLNTSLRGERKI